MSLPSINFLHLTVSRYSLDKVTTARSKVKSRSDHNVAHLHPLTNIATKYQLPTPYSFRDIAWTRFYRSRSLRQGQIKVTPWRCTPTPPNQCPYQVSTSYTLRFLRYSPDKLFPAPAHQTANPPAHLDTMGENNTLTALKGCGVKNYIQLKKMKLHYNLELNEVCLYQLLHVLSLVNEIQTCPV